MRNKKDKKREQLTYYAKILIVISFVFFNPPNKNKTISKISLMILLFILLS